MRVATIDIGTNTVLLLVAERNPNGGLAAIVEEATITRLGAGVDQTRRLAPEAVARTCECLRRYAAIVWDSAVERIAVVGTSAMRDAAGGHLVVDVVRDTLGVEARVLSGADEARLSFSGATSGLNLSAADLAVFDIGGGSTEIAIGQPHAGTPRLAYSQSFDVGSVRFTERHVRNDPPTQDELESVNEAARQAFDHVPKLASGTHVIGVAGTMTTLAAVNLGMAQYDGARLHGEHFAREDLRQVVHRLAGLDLKERRLVAGMEPLRADVIVAGGAIAIALLEHWNANAVIVSDRGVRWGLAEELSQE